MNRKTAILFSLVVLAVALGFSAIASAAPHANAVPAAAGVPAASHPAAAAEPVPPHPEIREALAALRRARLHMAEAAHDFGGHRVEALKATDEAIRQLEICLKYE